MNEKKAPQNPMTEKNKGLSSAQEVTYKDEFKKADNIVNDKKNKSNGKNKKISTTTFLVMKVPDSETILYYIRVTTACTRIRRLKKGNLCHSDMSSFSPLTSIRFLPSVSILVLTPENKGPNLF